MPCVAHFCHIFQKPFKLPAFEIEVREGGWVYAGLCYLMYMSGIGGCSATGFLHDSLKTPGGAVLQVPGWYYRYRDNVSEFMVSPHVGVLDEGYHVVCAVRRTGLLC